VSILTFSDREFKHISEIMYQAAQLQQSISFFNTGDPGQAVRQQPKLAAPERRRGATGSRTIDADHVPLIASGVRSTGNFRPY